MIARDGAVDHAGAVAGFVVDEWSETVPDAQTLTGVALRLPRPRAQAPQSILLAVAPTAQHVWDLDSLEAVVLETLQLARVRAVDLEALDAAGSAIRQYLPAAYLAANAAGATVSTVRRPRRGHSLTTRMPTDQPSITTWTRLEPVSRGTDVADGVEAALLDPLWLLARQWQLCEFAGDDRGSPALTTLDVLTQPLEYVVAPDGGASVGLPAGRRSSRSSSASPRATTAGSAWRPRAAPSSRGCCASTAWGTSLRAWTRCSRFRAVGGRRGARPGRGQPFGVVGGRVPDGGAIAAALGAALGPDRSGPLPAQPAVPAAREPALRTACAAFLDCTRPRSPQPPDPAVLARRRLRYAFSVTAGGASAGASRRRALDGDRVDWWSFDLAAAPPQAAGVRRSRCTRRARRSAACPRAGTGGRGRRHRPRRRRRRARRPAAAAAARVRTRLRARLVARPVPVPAGAITRVSGRPRRRHLRPQHRVRHHAEVDGPDRTWRMFEHGGPAAALDGSLLLVPPTLTGDLHSEPIEEVCSSATSWPSWPGRSRSACPAPRAARSTAARAQRRRPPPRPPTTATGAALRPPERGAAQLVPAPARHGPGNRRFDMSAAARWHPAPAPTRSSAAPAGRLLADRNGRPDPRGGAAARGRRAAAPLPYVRSPEGETHVRLARSRRTGRARRPAGRARRTPPARRRRSRRVGENAVTPY